MRESVAPERTARPPQASMGIDEKSGDIVFTRRCRIDNRGIDLERGSKTLYILTDEDNGQLLRIVPR
jgi:hypothetical protein